MLNNEAAIWSAVAASFAALSSFLIYRTGLKNLRVSCRPDIILENWSRPVKKKGKPEEISFTEIQNIGNGTAQHVYINSFSNNDDNKPSYFMSTSRVPVIPKGEKILVDNVINIFWENVVADEAGRKKLSVQIKILYWDIIGIRHSKSYDLFVVENIENTYVSHPIAPGIMLMSLITNSTPVWRLKCIA